MTSESKILIVDDNYESVKLILTDLNIDVHTIKDHVSTSKEALKKLKESEYDLLIIDLQIPETIGEDVDPAGGMKLLEYVDSIDDINKPIHILGYTSHKESYDLCKDTFYSMGWSLILKTEDSSIVKKIIEAKLRHARNPNQKYDVCILTALNYPELDQLLKVNFVWIPVKFDNDINIYHSTYINTSSDKKISIISTCCEYMGMAQSSAMAMKMCLKFSPKYMIMTGIAAGIKDKVNLGDILISDICWDWGNGKQTIKNGKPAFLSAPRQISLEPVLKAKFTDIVTNRKYLDEIYNDWPRSNRPSHALNAHIGPVATGAVVLEDPSIVEMIQSQHRETIGVEMEGYGVALASKLSRTIPPKHIIIKSVCDFADPNKNNEWQEYAAYTSAQLTIKFIQNHLFD